MISNNYHNIESNFTNLFHEINECQKYAESNYRIFRRICDIIILCKGTGLIKNNISILQEVLNNMIEKYGIKELSNEIKYFPYEFN